MEYHCPMCVYVTRYHKDFCIHIVRVHKNDPRFIVYCQIGQCAFSTKVWNSYKQHISKYHRNVCINDLAYNGNNDLNDQEGDEPAEENNLNMENPLFFNAGYLLSLESQHNISQSAINIIAENTSELIQMYVNIWIYIERKLRMKFKLGELKK